DGKPVWFSRDPLWFSLRLSHRRAKDLRDAFTKDNEDGGYFKALVEKGAEMAPASYAALCLALEAVPESERIGADILVPQDAFSVLQALAGGDPDADGCCDVEI